MVRPGVNSVVAEKSINEQRNVESVDLVERQPIGVWRSIYLMFLLSFFAYWTALVAVCFRNLEVLVGFSDANIFALVWLIIELLVFLVGVVREFLCVRTVGEPDVLPYSYCPNNCDFLVIVWGVVGIIGFVITKPDVSIDCVAMEWVGVLVTSIVSVIVVVFARIFVKVFY